MGSSPASTGLKITRRSFLKIMAITAALASVAEATGSTSLLRRSLTPSEKSPGSVAGDALIPTTCGICRNHCQLVVSVQDGVIRAIYPNPETREATGSWKQAPMKDEDFEAIFNWGICPKGVSSVFHVYNPYRLKVPLKRTNPEKGPGVDPGWVEITWDEALDEIANRIRDAMSKDPRKVIIQYAAGKYLVGDKFLKALAKAVGTPNAIHRTTICEAGRHVADELTWGYHGILPDLKYTRYLIIMGANPGEADQWARWLNYAIALAKERGMKVIVVEPRMSVMAAKADKWIPIKPAKDIIFLLAMAKILIENGFIDEEFLVNYTNAPYLVGPDGKFLRDENGNPMVWDKNTNSPSPFVEGVRPALWGTYEINGATYKTAFQVFYESIKDLDPAFVEQETGVPWDVIEEVAIEFGREARIGSTIRLEDGNTYRYRPVAIYTFRGLVTHEYGAQGWRAGLVVQMIVGSLGAVGGLHLHSPYKKPKLMEPSKAEYPPQRVDLQESIYYPHATHNVAEQVALTLINPAEYGLEYEPEVQFVYGANRVFAVPDINRQIEGYKKIWTAVVDIVLSEMAEMADIVLPDLTFLESWQYVISSRYTPYTKHEAIRQPVIQPVIDYPFEGGGITLLFELAKRIGVYEEFVKAVNSQWGLSKYALDPTKSYKAKDVVAAIWMEKTGQPFDYAVRHGFYAKKIPPSERYKLENIFGGPGKPKIHLYCEELVIDQENIRNKVLKYGVKNINLDELPLRLSPIPRVEHAIPSIHREFKDYPLYLITYKRMYRRQSGDLAMNPLLNELTPDSDTNYVVIHVDTAKSLGISDGDEVVVESPIGKIRLKAKLSKAIHPEVVAISYHYGHFSRDFPDYAKKGANPNWIIVLRPDMISGMTNFNDTKVRVYKA
ncbi:MAG: molybdopterin-dependent oxidoreductase [Desulfurococcales archaeon]|nr:molybdopterin-dependent oxidoreductase [Desulfurococcales archaeon]